jgi:hypothetical protein
LVSIDKVATALVSEKLQPVDVELRRIQRVAGCITACIDEANGGGLQKDLPIAGRRAEGQTR